LKGTKILLILSTLLELFMIFVKNPVQFCQVNIRHLHHLCLSIGDSARGTFPCHKKLGSDDGSLSDDDAERGFEHYHSEISALDAKPSVLATPRFPQFLILRRTPPNKKRLRNARSFIAMNIR